MNSLKGVIGVTRNQPTGFSRSRPPVVQVPNMVPEAYIDAHIKPLLRQYGSLRILTYFPSTSMRIVEATGLLDPIACLAMFGLLQLQPQVRGIVDVMVQSLGKQGGGPKASVIAVDMGNGILHSKICRQEGERDLCNVKAVGEFLRKTGFGPETAIYVARPRWHDNLNPLRDLFPRTYTKVWNFLWDFLMSRSRILL